MNKQIKEWLGIPTITKKAYLFEIPHGWIKIIASSEEEALQTWEEFVAGIASAARQRPLSFDSLEDNRSITGTFYDPAS